MTRVAATTHVLALTIDLCDASPLDEELFAFLAQERLPAAVFVSGIFARAWPERVRALGRERLFTVENHGLHHRPCSIDGRRVFGIPGTRGLAGETEEIAGNSALLASLTGRRPIFYRAGTAHFDDVCVELARRLGEEPVGFTVAADGGAAFSESSVRHALLAAPAGSIVLLHGLRARGFAFEGLRDALPELRTRGVALVALAEALRLAAPAPP